MIIKFTSLSQAISQHIKTPIRYSRRLIPNTPPTTTITTTNPMPDLINDMMNASTTTTTPSEKSQKMATSQQRHRRRSLTPFQRSIGDKITLLSLFTCLITRPAKINTTILLLTTALILRLSSPAGSSGITAVKDVTNRWPLSLPLLPFMVLQFIRRTSVVQSFWLSSVIVAVLSFGCLVLAGVLSHFFPVVELPPPPATFMKRSGGGSKTVTTEEENDDDSMGLYNVGIRQLFLPQQQEQGHDNNQTTTQQPSSLNVRIFYPTNGSSSDDTWSPHLSPLSSHTLCSQLMLHGAPHPHLKKCGFLLHTWRLLRLNARQNAPLPQKRLPIVVFSHGLFGCADLYSQQGLSMASRGYVVLMMNHEDGSAPVVRREDGSEVLMDRSQWHLAQSKETYQDFLDHVRARTSHRSTELLSALSSLLRHPTFSPIIDPQNIILMGHSFGGATALTAAQRRPALFKAVVTHDPAIQWMPDEERGVLCEGRGDEEERREDGEEKKEGERRRDVHDLDLLFLYCEEWTKGNWGDPQSFQRLHSSQKFGRPDGPSKIKTIAGGSRHQEFSDVGVITPRWLAKATKMIAGEREPGDILNESARLSGEFVDEVVGRR